VVESYISVPVPVVLAGRLAAAFFATIAVPLPDGTNYQVYGPQGRIWVDWENERVLGGS
jgi:hypothetical protein